MCDVVIRVAAARFTRTLGTLITSGVTILQSLRITKEVLSNEVMQNAVQKVHGSVKEGDTITAPLNESKVFPPMVVNMIDMGEETGSLDSMLVKVADIYDAEMGAVMLTIFGGVVGFIVTAMYLPILTMADAMGGA